MNKVKFEKQGSVASLNLELTPANKNQGFILREGIDSFSFTNKAVDTPLNQNNSFEDFINNPISDKEDYFNPFKNISPITRRQKAKLIDQVQSQRLLLPDQGSFDLSKCSHCPL